jgi:ABC-2 type transport system ATP-binding protein
MTSAIVVSELTKQYPGGTKAVCGVSFSVAPGEIVGLVGPNGAGKSTTLNMLATLVSPTSGDAQIFGVSIRNRAAVRRLVGVALQTAGLDPLMSADDHFRVHAALYGMRAREARVRAGELLELFELEGVRSRRTGELSGGTQRRLALALSLLHNPKAIIFDEPTVGLDPNLRRAVWDLLRELRARGLAVLFSTHYMDEADSLCQRIELMSKGEIVVSGTPDELKARVATGILRLRVRDPFRRADDALGLATRRGLIPPGGQYSAMDSVIEIRAELADCSVSALVSLLEEFGVGVADLRWGHGSLDDVFTRLAESTMDESQLQPVTLEHRALARRDALR